MKRPQFIALIGGAVATLRLCGPAQRALSSALMSYGVNLMEVFRDVAVDQVARGSKAGDLRIRAPSHFRLTFNARCTKTLHLEMSLLRRTG